MKRIILALVLVAALLLPASTLAQRGGHRSSSSHSSASRSHSSTGSKTVHVREYTRKDGTVVRAHERRAPGTAIATHPFTTYRRGRAAEGYTLHSTVQRDSHGRIKRSKVARSDFVRQRPCPSTGKTSGRCPGYVVDHVTALECGGADAPSNMQWQTVAAAKAKDKVEHRGCGQR